MFKGGIGAADGGTSEPASSGPGVLTSSSRALTRPARTVTAHRTRFGPTRIASSQRARAAEPDARSRSKWMQRYVAGLVVIDALSAAIAVTVAFLVRFGIPADVANYKAFAAFLVLLPATWVAVVAMNRAYEGRFVGAGQAEFDRLFKAFLSLTALVAIASYASHADLARGFVVVALPLTLLLDAIGRYRARKFLHHQRARGKAMTAMLLVGDAPAIIDVAALLRRDHHAGMRVIGACVPSEMVGDPRTAQQLAEHEIPLLGDIDSILDAIHVGRADVVAIVSSATVGPERLRWISWQLEGTPVELVVSPGLIEIAGPRLHIQPVAGLPLVHVEEPEFTGFRRVLKGAFDCTVAALALLVLAPVALAVAGAVRLTSRGPVLFRQQRIGRNGQAFTMLKFRSMYVDAEQRRAELEQLNVNADGLLFKVRNDPRITPVGRFIRKYSLDELPQLLNVLSGRMSLVGPRPPLPAEVALYGDDMRRRLLVKPGITGLWQISGRSDLSWDETKQLDLRYVENWSLGSDLMILWKTPSAVARGSGAY